MIVIAIMGLLVGVGAPYYAQVRPAATSTAAVSAAMALNMARVSYGLTIPDAATQWAACSDDASRLSLLVSANLVPSNFSLSRTDGYTLSMSGGLRTATIVTAKDGSVVSYSN